MKIVHTEASCGWGGQELRILSEASGLIGRGHEVALLCPPQAKIFMEAARFDVPAVGLPIARKKLAGLLALRRWLARNPVDVVNTHSSTDAWLMALACKMLARPPAIVRTRHISAPLPVNAGTRWLYTRGTAHIVTTGERLRETLIRDLGLPAARITSVPTGIDMQRFVPGDKTAARLALELDPAPRYIGIVATLRSWKGHLFLLEACTRLKGHDWRLLIVGEGPMRDVIEAKIAAVGLNGHADMVGHRDDPERWLQALDVFCLPSYANEGVPQALLQAMLTGLPIVTTPVGGITEAVRNGESALIVAPQQAEPLAAALQCLLDDPALSTRIGAAARETALARFGREAMLDAMDRIFALASHRSASI